MFKDTKAVKYLIVFSIGIVIGISVPIVYIKYNVPKDITPKKVYKAPKTEIADERVKTDETERTKDLDLASGHVEKTENTDIVKGKSTEKSNRLNAQPVKTKKLNVNSVLTESSSDIAGNNNPDNTPLKSTTKEKTDYLKSIGIIPSDSSSKVEVYEGGGSLHQDEFDAIRRVESAEFGTRSHYEAIQNLINVLGSSNSPGFRLMASTMMLKDIDGNTITTWEGYQNYAERISQD